MTMRILSVRRRSPRMEQKTRFQLRTKRSHDPLWRGVAGGLNLLLIFLWTRSSGASSLFFLMFSTSSVFLPTNYVPLSDQITENVPRRAANVSIPKTHELVSREETTFGCTARVVKHVNKKPHRFSLDRRTVTKSGQTSKAAFSMQSASRSSVAQFNVSASQLIKFIKSVSSLVLKKSLL